MKSLHRTIGFALLALLIGSGGMLLAATAKNSKSKNRDQIQRTAQLFDVQQNTVSNIQFYTSNYGIFGLNVAGNAGGGFWPRNSGRAYIFGGGIWFAAKKTLPGEQNPNKLVAVTYNPNSGNSWMAPGRISDGDALFNDGEAIRKYRTYFSTDFDIATGEALIPEDGPNWPIWDTDLDETLKEERYLGRYVDDIDARNTEQYPKGPAFISQEDIFAVYKDTDLSLYEGGRDFRQRRGYPMRLQYEQTIYSWGFGDYKDFIFIVYTIINRSNDVLEECWMAPAMDMDIALATNQRDGADNDLTRFYDDNGEDTLNLAVQWSEGTRGENGNGFGYIGFDFLESPAVDDQNNLRKDKKFYSNDEQLGLVTFRNWIIENDPTNDEERYDFMSLGIREPNDGNPGDKRFLMATGPFNMFPGDTARVVVGIVLANASTDAGRRTTPDGSAEDLRELVRKDKFAQTVYDDNFKAPQPPLPSQLSWQPLNNGMVVSWDSLSETSVDSLEDGLDFLGYRLYRARRLDLDTFAIDQLTPDDVYTSGRGPFGWKQVGQWVATPPFQKSAVRGLQDDQFDPRFERAALIDSITVLGLDTAAGRYNVARYGQGVWPNINRRRPAQNDTWSEQRGYFLNPNLPWYDFFDANQDEWREMMIGTITYDKALIENPVSALDTTAEDSVYAYIQRGWAKLDFADYGDRADVRAFVMQMIDTMTNGRRFVDIGDDNGDGRITETDDITTTERLINNVNYFYRMLAIDEGDYNQRTPGKLNSGQEGRNIIQAFPLAPPAHREVEANFTISPEDSCKLGGFYNFRFDIQDPDRIAQLYSGHEFEIEFVPTWSRVNEFNVRDEDENTTTYTNLGFYGRDVVIRDLTDGGRVVAEYPFYLMKGDNLILGSYAENGVLYVGTDTSSVGIQSDTNVTIVGRGGTFSSNELRWAPNQLVNGAFGFKFDHYLQQYGGTYRPFAAEIQAGSGTTPNTPLTWTPVPVITQVGEGEFVSFNNGPGEYEVEFFAGGEELVTIEVRQPGGQTRSVDFLVPYLNVRVHNRISYQRPVGRNETATVSYPCEMPHQTVESSEFITITNNTRDTVRLPYPDPRVVDIGSYNLSSYGWLNGHTGQGSDAVNRKQMQAACVSQSCPVGTQGRYYLSVMQPDGMGGTDTLRFSHVLAVGGIEFVMDFANKRGRNHSVSWSNVGGDDPTVDFKAGDKVIFRSFGGALGVPLPDAKVRATFNEVIPELNEYTNDLLDQIKVVPNPFYVTHVGQPTTDDAKIYFTHLPERCTIKIFTINGDLVRTIEHDEATSGYDPGTRALEVFNLLSDGRQRVGSQTLVAHITTPNGAEHIAKFSVITGGFRNVAR